MASSSCFRKTLLVWGPALFGCAYLHGSIFFHPAQALKSPQFFNPSLDQEEVELNFRGHLFDKAHVLVLSSCRLKNLARPISFIDSQVTAEWNQSALLEFEPARTTDCQVYIGAGYSLKRYALSSHFGEHVYESISPSVLFPITISYARPHRHGSASTAFNMEYEFDGQSLIKNCAIFHNISYYEDKHKELHLFIYAKEMFFYQNIVDQEALAKAYLIGLNFEQRSF